MEELIKLLEDMHWQMNNLLAVVKTFPNEHPNARQVLEDGVNALNERAVKVWNKHSLTTVVPDTTNTTTKE